MKKFTSTFSFILLITLLSAFTFANDWQLFETSDFQILYPKLPSSQTQTINSVIGDLKVTGHIYNASKDTTDANLTYGVLTTEYPDTLVHSDKKEILSNFFRSATDGAVKNVNGKLISEKEIELDGFPGRDIKIDLKGFAVMRMKAFLVKNKLYMLQTITKTEKDGNQSVEKFMNSFKLK